MLVPVRIFGLGLAVRDPRAGRSTSATSGTTRSTCSTRPRLRRWPASRTCLATSRPRPPRRAAVAARNGYAAATGATVTPAADVADSRRLDVTITKSFGHVLPARCSGSNRSTISRTATAEYTLPVPMGSPLSSLGDGTGQLPGGRRRAGHGPRQRRRIRRRSTTRIRPSTRVRPERLHVRIDVPAGAGSTTIDLYDATFCAVDANKGTGDRWLPWNQSGWPSMSTYYTLWSDPAETPLDYTDDIAIASSGTLFEHERQSDRSSTYRETSASWPGSSFFSLTDCTSSPYHNAWWTLATVTTPGFYRLQVTTTDATEPRRPEGHERLEQVGPPRRLVRPGVQGPCPRTRQDGHLRQHPERHDELLPRPDRGRPRRQDDGRLAVRPGRREWHREHPGPQADDHRLHAGHLQLHRRLERGVVLPQRHQRHESRRPSRAAPAGTTTRG